jgi:hypothetical protein
MITLKLQKALNVSKGTVKLCIFKILDSPDYHKELYWKTKLLTNVYTTSYKVMTPYV